MNAMQLRAARVTLDSHNSKTSQLMLTRQEQSMGYFCSNGRRVSTIEILD